MCILMLPRDVQIRVCCHLSAALKMPLAACALRSGGQEERKMSSSFIMERMLEAVTSDKERSNARLERRDRDQ